MNYFELYGIPPHFLLDQHAVKAKYYVLTRQYHPDFFAQKSREEQATALQMTSDINQAYKIFMDKNKTIYYLLNLRQLIEPEEKYPLSPSFLTDMMDLNEAIMDQTKPPEQIKQFAQQLNHQHYETIKPILEAYKHAETPKEDLLPVKEYYYQTKYIQRILDKLN